MGSGFGTLKEIEKMIVDGRRDELMDYLQILDIINQHAELDIRSKV